jgi:pSer/pThr/pTyr-binding forkhead associated (FHA) protein
MWFIKHIKTGEILNINQEKTTIGRLGTTHVIKNDESISRKHCTFLLKQNELRIIDDGAKYGTTIQNDQIKKVSKEPMTLKDGDKVQFGCYENIWEIHCKHEARAGIKRKSDDVEAIENSSSVSNISKKPKENPINAKIIDKFDVIIDSDDDKSSKSSRGARNRKNLINYSEDIIPSTSKNKATENKTKKVAKIDEKPSQINKKVDQAKESQQDKAESVEEPQQPAKEAVRSQIVYDDSDEDIFSPSHEENSKKSKSGTNNRKMIIESDDDLMAFNVPMKAINARKRPTNDIEDGGSSKKIAKTVKNAKNTNEIKKVVPQRSTKKASSDEVDKSISCAPVNPSQNSRKRDLEDEVFNFDDFPNKHQIKKPRNAKKNEISSEELAPVASISTSSVKSFSFKTSKISDKEVFASFDYNIDEDSSSWLSTRVSKIKVKDETHDKMDHSVNNSIDSHYSINLNIIRKDISLDTTCESKKSFRKQKFLESNKVVTLKKLNVNEMNYCFSKQEEESADDWS